MSQFKTISLDKLEATTQTRQFFDEAALNELASSIAAQGILQPILVRDIGKKFQIIAGERRFRAAKIAGLSEVPCHVVEMDDNQALEAQITENLQRKDVHPMEEAHAFKRLVDDAKMSIEEIAGKVGKGVRYVAGRLKLIDLSEDFQKAFFADKMPVAGAILIAAMDEKFQADYWDEDWARNWQEEDFYKTLSDIEREIDYMANELKEAKFDITDSNLVPSAGACTDCRKNTACYKLLFQEEGKGRCTDRDCFENKTKVHKQALLKDIVDNHPEYIFLPNRYYTDRDKLAAIKALGVEIADPKKWDVAKNPEPPDPDMWDLEDEDEKENYEEEVEEYEKEKKHYEEAIASGLLRKAYDINNDKVIDVIPAKDVTNIPEPGSLDDTDPLKATHIRMEAELKELEQKRSRNDEIVSEKMYEWYSDQEENWNEYIAQDCAFNLLEQVAMYVLLFDKCSYSFQRDFCQDRKIERDLVHVYKYLSENSGDRQSFVSIARAAIVQRFTGGEGKFKRQERAVMQPIAESYLAGEYNSKLTELFQTQAKRNAALDKTIAELKTKLIKP